jgi:hypothetical protein
MRSLQRLAKPPPGFLLAFQQGQHNSQGGHHQSLLFSPLRKAVA